MTGLAALLVLLLAFFGAGFLRAFGTVSWLVLLVGCLVALWLVGAAAAVVRP